MKRAICLSTILAICTWVNLNAQTVYVDASNGSDAGIGTKSARVATIEKANELLNGFAGKDLVFKGGIIEADIASPVGGNGLVGIAFRIADAHHCEVVYFRPGSSGTINALQYMPEKKTDFNWWDYEANKYEAKATLPVYSWFHVKVMVKGQQMTV